MIHSFPWGARARPEDPDRFAREFRPILLRMFRAFTADGALAEDLVQRTLLRALTALPDRREGSLRGWVCRIGYREFLHACREARYASPLDEQTPDSLRLSPDALVLEAAIAALSPDLRDAFVLREVQRLSVRETAESLGIPSGTVKSRLHAAKSALRASLSETFHA